MGVLKKGGRVALGCTGWNLSSTRRAVAGAVGDVARTCLSDSSVGKMSVVLVDGGLHLLQDLIDRGQVTSGLCVAHWW